ncbi:transcription and mRNA export factor Sus1p [Trichomonascus vanleenenianus]|uniref:Sus1p n=1 Tax=Trichomonascus vanleenenianus TaxID=2268995 RepID=UPI003ECB9D83
MAEQKDQLQAAVINRMLESGEYDRMKKILRTRLRETGWFDEVNEMALEELSGLDDPNFERISKKLEPQALNIVPEDIKLEMLKMIKTFLDGTVEKAP